MELILLENILNLETLSGNCSQKWLRKKLFA